MLCRGDRHRDILPLDSQLDIRVRDYHQVEPVNADAPGRVPGLRQGRHPVDPGRHPALLREMRVRGLDVDADRMTTPIARTTDPWTSHAGAVEVTDSGRRRTQAERCLDVVLTRPGLTAGRDPENSTGLGHGPGPAEIVRPQSRRSRSASG